MPTPTSRSMVATLGKLALGVYWVALLVATHVPPATDLLPTQQNDKILHFGAYFLLALLLAVAGHLAGGVLTARHLVIAWLGTLAYGAFDELTQTLVRRECSLADWVADGLGAAAGLLVFAAVRQMIGLRSRP